MQNSYMLYGKINNKARLLESNIGIKSFQRVS